ncbi:hypothetical protein OIV83_004013 [Microbotryomycetes sp. JL201]|nr:hypothetical protein OIV83_004013 [Microbotryomycetes sp. JL201]
MLTTLGKFVFPESQALPNLVLEIVAPRLSQLANRLEQGDSAPVIDLSAIRRVIKPFWLAEVSQAPTTTTSVLGDEYLISAKSIPGKMLLDQVETASISLHALLQMDAAVPCLTIEQQTRRRSRLRRLATVVASQPSASTLPQSRITFPTLYHFLSRDLSSLLLEYVSKTTPLIGSFDVLADIVCTTTSHAVLITQHVQEQTQTSSTLLSPSQLVNLIVEAVERVKSLVQHAFKTDKTRLDVALDQVTSFMETIKKDDVLGRVIDGIV